MPKVLEPPAGSACDFSNPGAPDWETSDGSKNVASNCGPDGLAMNPIGPRPHGRPEPDYLSAWMRSAGTSTSVTPRNENSNFTRYLGGCSEVCLMMCPTASVTAA